MTNRIRISPTRFSDEVFTPGSNNKYTKGRNLKIRNQENDINNLNNDKNSKNNKLDILVCSLLIIWGLTLGLSMFIIMYSTKFNMPIDYVSNIMCFVVSMFAIYLVIYLIKILHICYSTNIPISHDEFYNDMYL